MEEKTVEILEADLKRIEGYLADVVQRLFDTENALNANLVYCRTRKEKLIEDGKSFEYDQGRIDTAMEIAKFATGELTLGDLIADMEYQKKMSKLAVVQHGMDAV